MTSELCFQNMKSAMWLMQIKNGIETTNAIDLAASLDGSCCSRGWTAKRGIVSGIAEISSQVIDVSYKCCSCEQC